jgi:hypothetical protein
MVNDGVTNIVGVYVSKLTAGLVSAGRAVRHTVYGYSHILYGCHTVYGYCMTYRIMYSTSVNGTVRLD